MFVLGSVLALALQSAAPSQQSGAATAPGGDSSLDQPIIVTAPRNQAERKRELRELAKALIRSPRQGRPIARFFYPVCPKVIGLRESEAEAIESRLLANAEQFGVGADRSPDCRPTMTVAFMSSSAGPPEAWLALTSPVLAHLPKAIREDVLSENGPVRAWNRTAIRDFDGRPLRFDEGFTEVTAHGGGPIVTNEITGAIVLMSLDAAEGKSTDQLADYASVRGFVGTSGLAPTARPSARTILQLFDSENAPQELTPFDRALISGLYQGQRNASPRRVFLDVAARGFSLEKATQQAKE